MNHARRGGTLFLSGFLSLLFLLACGGQSLSPLGDAGDAGGCSPASCAANEVFDPVRCGCQSVDDSGTGLNDDAAIACPPIACPEGWKQGIVAGECACVPVGGTVDAGRPPSDASDASTDAMDVDARELHPPDAAPSDATLRLPGDSSSDATVYPYEGGDFDATPAEDVISSCGPTDCGPGYETTPSCQCIECTNSCPPGQTPAAGCAACLECNKCPAGFVFGSGCNCGPPGTDAGPSDAGDGGGACLLEGYQSCSAGSWCSLGVCPDGTTQYGCYCSADGTANCVLTCPPPPPCTIPGLGTCPYGQQCVFDSCNGDAASSQVVCTCNGANGAYCSVTPCGSDAGIIISPSDAGDAGGVTCLLEGYYTCSAGSWCALGFCPNGVHEYGCYCNQDGTATCDLTCPTPPPCTIPGEGTCAYGSQCTFGGCDGGAGTTLTCYCSGGGSASCYTSACGSSDAAAVVVVDGG